MKIIILAAGQGTRLMPLTADKPKCMVEYKGKPLIDHLMEVIHQVDIGQTVVVTGYQSEVLRAHLSKYRDVQFYHNRDYANTNMVHSLFCAEEEMDDEDIIISYSDIVFNPKVLKKLFSREDDFSVVVDKNWKDLWQLRMENPLEDAETLKINTEGQIVEIGKKPSSYDEIQGQYIGLIKIKGTIVKKIREFYHDLDKTEIYDGKDFNNMFLTSFLQLIIEYQRITPCYIEGGWIEIDSKEDLEILSSYSI